MTECEHKWVQRYEFSARDNPLTYVCYRCGVKLEHEWLDRYEHSATIDPQNEPGSFASVLPALLMEGKQIRRKSEPSDYYEVDGAEGGTIWKYHGEEDDLIKDWKFDLHQLAAMDWEASNSYSFQSDDTPNPHAEFSLPISESAELAKAVFGVDLVPAAPEGGKNWKARAKRAEAEVERGVVAHKAALAEARKAHSTILAVLGNVEHRGGGENAARMYADMLNDIREIARHALTGV